MNAEASEVAIPQKYSNLPPKAKYLKQLYGNFEKKDKWMEEPLEALLDSKVDSYINKIVEGEVQVPDEKSSCEDVIIKWEISQKQKEYQQHILSIKNQGLVLPNKEIDDSLIGQYGQAKVSNLNARNLSYRAQNMSMDAKDMHESLHPGSSNNQNASMVDYKDTNDAIVSYKHPHKRINTNDEEPLVLSPLSAATGKKQLFHYI